ncbi:MAG TPA: imidazolonepropionase [Phycisphaerae bacterium]|nr:imidazolonepropionase [Phycisphaerae bacterium]
MLVMNCTRLLTLAGPSRPRIGDEMNDLGEVESGAVVITDGKILETGPAEQLNAKYDCPQRINAAEGIIMPGLVDCHTHAIFLRPRADELAQRAAGVPYLDILAAGGGIYSTVRSVLAAGREHLRWETQNRLDAMLAHGTTTVEIKSGYGLNLETERKMLQIAGFLDRRHPMDIVATFLGAHVVPENMDRAAYVDFLVDEALGELKGLAEFCDVFCDAEAFTLDEARRIFSAALEQGYKLKIHAGQFTDMGAAGLAAEFGAVSADHLEHVSDEQLAQMHDCGTLAVLLPGAALYLMSETYADARRMIDAGVPVAVATDFNPGSCPCFSMQMMISLACLKLKLTPAEAVTAATINAAYALDRGDRVGSLEPGKQADLIIVNTIDERELACHFGVNNVRTVIKAGKVV